jgi:hypothetical protein
MTTIQALFSIASVAPKNIMTDAAHGSERFRAILIIKGWAFVTKFHFEQRWHSA